MKSNNMINNMVFDIWYVSNRGKARECLKGWLTNFGAGMSLTADVSKMKRGFFVD